MRKVMTAKLRNILTTLTLPAILWLLLGIGFYLPEVAGHQQGQLLAAETQDKTAGGCEQRCGRV